MKRCLLCVLPETYPGIKFDPQGRCNFCLDYQPLNYGKEGSFQDLLGRHSKGRGHDFLVPLSGGRDSSYVLFQMVRRYGFKVAAYNYDNMFVDQLAKDNIKRITDCLGVPLIQFKSRTHNLARRCFLKVNLQRTPLHFMYCLCYGCPNGIWGGARRVADSLGVDLIIMGESREESAAYKVQHQAMLPTPLKEKLRMLMKKPIPYLGGKCLQEVLSRRLPCEKSLSSQRAGFVNFFDYHPYNETRIINILEKEVGWKGDKNTSWRFDCKIHSLSIQMAHQLMGMTEWDDMLSKFVRKGEITRDEALIRVNKFQKYRELLKPENEDILKKLGLSKKERVKVLDFCEGPPRLRNTW